jgi:hypothetical protein
VWAKLLNYTRFALLGLVGNPAGRPKGARSKFSEEFLQAFAKDFQQHGEAVIQKVRKDRPSDYLKIAASFVPRQMEVETSALTDEERLAERERLIAEYEAQRGLEAIN